MKNAVDHGTCDKITDGGGDSEAQVPVSSLICPVARFFCQRIQVCVRVMVWLSRCCSCGILLAGSVQVLSWPLQPAVALKGFVSSIGSSSVVRNKANPDHH